MPFSVNSQGISSLFSVIPTNQVQLNPEQQVRYQKIVNSDYYFDDLVFITIGDLAQRQSNGKVSVSFPNSPCDQTVFRGGEVMYESGISIKLLDYPIETMHNR